MSIIDTSAHGHPALWTLSIDPGSGHVEIFIEPELLHFTAHRRAIDELVSRLAMHLHQLNREAQR